MAIMEKVTFEEKYVQIPNVTALAPEKNLSLQALGLIVNLWSYDVTTWELHKTELYKRFVKNKETSVRTAWTELMENKYIVEFKYRVGRSWDYVYYYNIKAYTEEQVALILESAKKKYGKIEDLNFQTSNCRPQNHDISNTNKSNTNKSNNNTFVNKAFNQNEMLNIFNDFYSEYASGRWSKKDWQTIGKQLINELLDEDGIFRLSASPKKYLRGCIKKISHHHDLKTGKKEFIYQGTKIPLYDWLGE